MVNRILPFLRDADAGTMRRVPPPEEVLVESVSVADAVWSAVIWCLLALMGIVICGFLIWGTIFLTKPPHEEFLKQP